MFAWWMAIFGIGVMALLETYYDFGPVFRQITAVMVLMSSLGLLTRIVRKSKEQTKEKLAMRVSELEIELRDARAAASTNNVTSVH